MARTYSPGIKYDSVIGVNRAAMFAPCDWWAALDGDSVRKWHRAVTGEPKLFGRSYVVFAPDAPEWLVNLPDSLSLELVLQDFPGIPHHRAGTFTAPAALLLAGYLGAKSIDVYGADWSNEPDWDGVRPSDYRHCERWCRESKIWNQFVSLLADRGVTVNRING